MDFPPSMPAIILPNDNCKNCTETGEFWLQDLAQCYSSLQPPPLGHRVIALPEFCSMVYDACGLTTISTTISVIIIVLSFVAHMILRTWRRYTKVRRRGLTVDHAPQQAPSTMGMVVFCLILAKIKIGAGVACFTLLLCVVHTCTIYSSQFLWPIVCIILGMIWLGRAHIIYHKQRRQREAQQTTEWTSDAQLASLGAHGTSLGKSLGAGQQGSTSSNVETKMKVIIPEGVLPGTFFPVDRPTGGQFRAVCPIDNEAGDQIVITVPPA